MPPRDDKPLHDRKVRDRALILPLVGVILFLPPVAGIFRLDATVQGVPLTLGYLFAVWALLITGAFALSRRLRASLDAPNPPAEPGDDR
jgi:hypothetical protein